MRRPDPQGMAGSKPQNSSVVEEEGAMAGEKAAGATAEEKAAGATAKRPREREVEA